MLRAISDSAKNLKNGARTKPWMKDLITAHQKHQPGSRTPSRSPDGHQKHSSGSRSRAEIFAAFGIGAPAPAAAPAAAAAASAPVCSVDVISSGDEEVSTQDCKPATKDCKFRKNCPVDKT